MREYCRAVGLQKVGHQYDIDPETVEEWRHCPPPVMACREAAAKRAPDPLDGPPIKRRVSDRVPGIPEARAARQRRLLDALREAGV